MGYKPCVSDTEWLPPQSLNGSKKDNHATK
jgi:hypothetical protein